MPFKLENLWNDGLAALFGKGVVRPVHCDVTQAESVTYAMASLAREFGGIDILATGYFLVGREGFKLMKQQNTGGSVVFIVSKNGLVASPGASVARCRFMLKPTAS